MSQRPQECWTPPSLTPSSSDALSHSLQVRVSPCSLRNLLSKLPPLDGPVQDMEWNLRNLELELKLDSAVLPAVNRMHLIGCVFLRSSLQYTHTRRCTCVMDRNTRFSGYTEFVRDDIGYFQDTPLRISALLDYNTLYIYKKKAAVPGGGIQPPCLRYNNQGKLNHAHSWLSIACRNAMDEDFLSNPKFYTPATVLSLITASKSRLQLPQ